MLDGMDGRRIETRLMVGRSHTDVVGGDDDTSCLVLTAHVDARLQVGMIDGETGDEVHRFSVLLQTR